MADKPTTRIAWGCLALFGLPFFAAGVLTLVKGVRGHGSRPDWPQICFAAVFIVVGLGIIAAGPIGAVIARRQRAREAQAPGQPWRWRQDWASGRIAGSATAAGGVPWLVGVVWLAIAGPIAAIVFSRHDAPVLFRGLFGLGFPIVGLLLMVAGILGVMRRRRFGQSWLTLDSVPAPPGGALSARLDCGVPDQLDPSFRLVLTCTETWTESGRGGKTSTAKTAVLWRDEYECLGERSAEVADGSQVAVRFDLPAAMPPCGKGTRGEISWRLVATSELPGVDYRDGFDVPVFPLPAGMTVPPPRPRPEPTRGRFATGRLEIADDGGETRVTFPPAMNPGLATVPTALLIVSGYLCWAYARAGTWGGAVPAGAVAALMLWAAGRAWLMRTTVIARRGELEVERSLLGLAWRRTWRSGEAEDVEVASNFSANGQPWYKISVSGARKAAVGSLIDSQGIAERARDALRGRFSGER